jgi:hypothetical protein
MAARGSAKGILADVPPDRAFFFYVALDHPTGVSATGLESFAEKAQKVDPRSLEFHLQRGDFEKWVYMLGDAELAKRLIKLRNDKPSGENLRIELVKAVRTRVKQLRKPAPSK